jgi:hypothetical protein
MHAMNLCRMVDGIHRQAETVWFVSWLCHAWRGASWDICLDRVLGDIFLAWPGQPQQLHYPGSGARNRRAGRAEADPEMLIHLIR